MKIDLWLDDIQYSDIRDVTELLFQDRIVYEINLESYMGERIGDINQIVLRLTNGAATGLVQKLCRVLYKVGIDTLLHDHGVLKAIKKGCL